MATEVKTEVKLGEALPTTPAASTSLLAPQTGSLAAESLQPAAVAARPPAPPAAASGRPDVSSTAAKEEPSEPEDDAKALRQLEADVRDIQRQLRTVRRAIAMLQARR